MLSKLARAADSENAFAVLNIRKPRAAERWREAHGAAAGRAGDTRQPRRRTNAAAVVASAVFGDLGV
jgi:hypothetical protein